MAKPYFDPVQLGTEVFDLTHLEPFTMEFQSNLAKKWLRVHVTFKNHCFTKSYKEEQHPAGEPIFDHPGPRPRTFCRIRYKLSKALPAIINSLNDPKTKVWQTHEKRNWAYSIKVEDPEGPYHIFFEVRRPSSHQKHLQDINLVVESAYHEEPGENGPNLIGSMAFYVLCGKIYTNKPVLTNR